MSATTSDQVATVAPLSDMAAFNERMLERVVSHYGFMAMPKQGEGAMVTVITFIASVPVEWLASLQIHFRNETGQYLAQIGEIRKSDDGFSVEIIHFHRYVYTEDVPAVQMGVTLATHHRDSRLIPMAEDSQNPNHPHFLPP